MAFKQALLAAGVDLAYRGWRLRDFSLPKHLPWQCGGYFLAGVQGCGKSCLAAALIRDRMDPAHPATLAVQVERFAEDGSKVLVWEWPPLAVKWFNARELCDHLRSSWQHGGEEQAISALLRYRILVIDDIGTEGGTVNQDAITRPGIRRVIDKCGHNGVELVVTTNLAPAELGDPRMGSRLCNLAEIELPAVDRRAENKRRRQKLQAKPCKFASAKG